MLPLIYQLPHLGRGEGRSSKPVLYGYSPISELKPEWVASLDGHLDAHGAVWLAERLREAVNGLPRQLGTPTL